MRLRIQQGFLVALFLIPAAAAAAEQCTPDCTHATKACVCALDGNDVVFTPIGGIDRERVELRQALEPGDEIMSADENAVVALTCAQGSDVKLHGRFRAVIMPPAQGQDCALNLLAGGADVLTDNPTQVSSGETLMGSRRTMYSMRVASDATVECLVFEGQVGVLNLKTGVTRPLGTNTRASWRRGELLPGGGRVTATDVALATRVYARADLARARARGVSIEDPASFQRALQARYTAVISRPDDPAARIELATLQTIAGIPRPALYHLERAERLNPTRTEQRTAIAATRSVAYRQMGREKEAAVESERLRRLDPARHKIIQQIDPRVTRVDRAAYDPSVLTAAVISATAAPPIVSAGEATTISVTARTRDGKPIGGAKVALSAGGGTFARTRQSRIEGVTDASGAFRTEWQCMPCAAAYQISVEVAAAQFPPGKTTVDVKTR